MIGVRFPHERTARHDVPYLDLTPAIHSAGVDHIYLNYNGRWKPSRHRSAAKPLRAFLDRLVDTASHD
jgi:hypothetical protein